MPFDFSDVVNDPDMALPYTIVRTTGAFGQGGWIANAPVSIPAFGVVSVASDKDLESIPEADQVKEARVFHSTQAMFVTSLAGEQTSDILVFNGVQYRVYKIMDQNLQGDYYRAIAARILGN